jgi:hypothetical protein
MDEDQPHQQQEDDATDLKGLGALLLGERRWWYARHRASSTVSDGRKLQLP